MYSDSRLINVRNITMFRQLESHNFLFRLVIGSLIIAAGFLFLPFLITSSDPNTVNAQSTSLPYDSFSTGSPDSPNVVTSGLSSMAQEVGLTAYQVKDGAAKSTRSARIATVKTSKMIANTAARSAKATIEGVDTGVDVIATTTGKGLSLVFRIPGNAISSVTGTAIVKNFIRPSEYEEVPIIDPNSPELLAALAALPPEAQDTEHIQPGDDSGPIWPIHGRVTTNFGVPHRPYQPTHTGIDISDGKRSGITPIKPFRSGTVIEATRVRGGYGNHVIIDHGNSVTSVYAHLASISVQVGQAVTTATTLGFEGSTGLSTGTHLHFEVRVNGKAADPRKFITGQP